MVKIEVGGELGEFRLGVLERAEVVVMGRDTTYEIKVRGRASELKLRANGQAVPAARP